MMTLRAPWLSSVCSSARESVDTRSGTSEALKVPVIWVSRSMRSTTIRIVGFVSSAIARSFCAVKTMSSDLPEPWKCQIRPLLDLAEQHPLDDQVGRLELLEPGDDLDLAVLLVGGEDREEPQEVQHRRRR